MVSERNFETWNLKKSVFPMLIAGPCSAESENQIMETASQLKKLQINYFRAGIWKPRTRPSSFEGVGSKGLPWLKKVQKELKLKVITEVANAKHIEEILKYNIDAIWIGARTSANPFAIQEIADALKGIDIPVFIKNPVNPDTELWIGAVERIRNAGITKIAAIHRGFSVFNKTNYRNAPQWQIPIELRQKMPNIPIICDPSHICGKTETLYEISQKALDLNFDGLIIETHHNPPKAWSDSQQQITPNELEILIQKLVVRTQNTENDEINIFLEDLRQKIDFLDEELLQILAQRMKLIEIIGKYKKKYGITVLQSERWRDILKKTTDSGIIKNLSQEFVTNLFKAIHQESINKQTQIMNVD